jgi:dihydropteroate synthase
MEEHPLIMGVVNVTPDSFSDGGEFFDHDAAVEHGRRMSAQGAAVIDVGGESTRPGAGSVGADEELRRTIPVIERLVAGRDAGPGHIRVSIDTSKAQVATAALGAGARIVNDVTAFRGDPEMAGIVAGAGAGCVLMHMQGEPRTMQDDPRYDDVVSDVKAFLEERLTFATGEGVSEEHVWLDPGIGFGKTVEHNLELLRRLGEIVAIGRPVCVGVSRKSFIGRIAGDPAGPSRVGGTVAANVLALERGASVFRVHDVAQTVEALRVAGATLAGAWTTSATS